MNVSPDNLRLLAKFRKRVVITKGCWTWNGAHKSKTLKYRGHTKYPVFRISNSRQVLAHRWLYLTLFNIDAPKCLFVCHHCDNPACVNPMHMFLGTQADNMRDCLVKGRYINVHSLQTVCKRGHSLIDPSNLYKNTKGRRICRICSRQRAAASMRRTRAKNKQKPIPPQQWEQPRNYYEDTNNN